MYKVVVNYGRGKVVFESTFQVSSKEEADTLLATLATIEKDYSNDLQLISMGYEKIKEVA